jgi:glycosyltransferase involved in cell wall biosynthesis
VDVERFVRIEPDKKLSRQQAILLPRNWTFPRGIHLAVLAFAKFVQRFPDTKLALAGEVFEFVRKAGAYKSYINRLIVDFHLTDKILFLGRVPWQQMPRIYSSVQMTLIPSLGVEGTSLSALESMACGTATISTDRGGLADLPTEQCPADENSLAEKMIDVYLRRQEIGQRQQAVVANRFNLDNWKKAWLNVILK